MIDRACAVPVRRLRLLARPRRGRAGGVPRGPRSGGGVPRDRRALRPDGAGPGRHPLPPAEAFAAAASRAGIGDGVFVVAYDHGGAGGAARLWWLLRHFGHEDAAVLRRRASTPGSGRYAAARRRSSRPAFVSAAAGGRRHRCGRAGRAARRAGPGRRRRPRPRALPGRDRAVRPGGRPDPGRGQLAARRCRRGAAGAPRGRGAGRLLRLRRDRLRQPARARPGRPPGREALPGLVERLVHPWPPGRARTSPLSRRHRLAKIPAQRRSQCLARRGSAEGADQRSAGDDQERPEDAGGGRRARFGAGGARRAGRRTATRSRRAG